MVECEGERGVASTIMSPKMVFIFSFILLLFTGINAYIGWNGYVFLNEAAGGIPPLLYWIPFAVVVFGYLIGRARIIRGPVGRLIKVIGAGYFAVMEFAFLLLPLADVLSWLLKRGGAEPAIYIEYVGYGVLAVLVLILIRGWRNAWSPVVREHRLEVPKSAGGLHSLRILVASDIHLGNIVGNRHLKRLIQKVEQLKPDLILLPGDVIDDDIEPFKRNNMAEQMSRLQAPYGVYAVLGNHEYYGGHIAEYVQAMDAIGIRVLRDETVTIEGRFHVAGRKDKTSESAAQGGRLPTKQLLEALDPALPILLMDHQPHQFEAAAAAGADLLLCGHTHRGQFAPNHWITKRLFELDWGYMNKKGMHVLVSSGFGLWGPPFRIASRSELLDVTLTFKHR